MPLLATASPSSARLKSASSSQDATRTHTLNAQASASLSPMPRRRRVLPPTSSRGSARSYCCRAETGTVTRTGCARKLKGKGWSTLSTATETSAPDAS
eukprot:795222-Prymnesium_polylepis.1